MFDELSVAYVQKGRLETCPLLKGWITYPEDLGYTSDIMVHKDEKECKKHIQNVLKYAAEATLKWQESHSKGDVQDFDQGMGEFKRTSEMQKTLACRV